MDDDLNFAAELGRVMAEAMLQAKHELTELRQKAITLHHGDIRAYARWRRNLAGKTCTLRRMMEANILRAQFHSAQMFAEGSQEQLIATLVSFHGPDVSLWPDRIPARIKQLVQSLLPADQSRGLYADFRDAAVRERFMLHISGQPRHLAP